MSEVTETRVGEALHETAEFIADHSYAKIDTITDPATREQLPVLLFPNGSHQPLQPSDFDRVNGKPSARKGTARLRSLDSFIDFVNRFGDSDSAVFVIDEQSNPSMTAVLDYNRADSLVTDDDASGSTAHGEYRFGEHRAVFQFPVSDEWNAWMAKDGEALTMAEFAQFLEERVLEVAEVDKVPESAARFVTMMGGEKNIADWSTLTALAKSLKVYENAVVSEATNLASGALSLSLNEEHETEVGGIKAEVPTMFFIDIPIFRDGVIYRLPVRLRWRKGRGSISFFYELWGHDRAFTDAMKEAVERVGNDTPAQTFYGHPEGA
tara:strand:+ start:11022 stop:11990 length:969 start_codon:yes stop_codon:yes gene_type:complete